MAWWKSDPRKLLLRATPSTITFVLWALLGHALYVTYNIQSIRNSLDASAESTSHYPIPVAQTQHENPPNLFVFRRSKKTGSTTMLDALFRALEPYEYISLYGNMEETRVAAKAESLRPNPRRLIIANHNQVTKSFEKNRNAVIADTFRDGYQQITSYCRFFRRVKECDERLIECLRSKAAHGENYYRWAYNNEEDSDTYIDLPLSSAHPALSTTVLRQVFPNATIEIDHYNVVNSTCPEIPALRNVYNELYQPLERQVQKLQKRMLIITGYPIDSDATTEQAISYAEMLDAAEAREKLKYKIRESTQGPSRKPKRQSSLVGDLNIWTKTGNGSVSLKSKFGG